MSDWSCLTNHARAVLCSAHDPGIGLRDIAAELDITDRHAYAIVGEIVDLLVAQPHRPRPAAANETHPFGNKFRQEMTR